MVIWHDMKVLDESWQKSNSKKILRYEMLRSEV